MRDMRATRLGSALLRSLTKLLAGMKSPMRVLKSDIVLSIARSWNAARTVASFSLIGYRSVMTSLTA